ncbi:hypothetical protein ColLi_06176 [Colletotrichum liriopes]|uniref:Uncharacterized protein n=1 Tax=Colletotrichum liriopes TaxID=708192 RepID=A0AA37LTF3_9PEZI|nr:hypothetical protein ColLi_06176 [Colletotrichum liriopes]
MTVQMHNIVGMGLYGGGGLKSGRQHGEAILKRTRYPMAEWKRECFEIEVFFSTDYDDVGDGADANADIVWRREMGKDAAADSQGEMK